MTANEIVWLVCGVAAGYLTATIATVYLLQWKVRRDRHPMQFDLRPAPTTANGTPEVLTVLDWDTAMDRELAARVLIPPLESVPARKPGPKPVVLEECAVCGKAFKRVSQHQRMAKHGVEVTP